MPRNSSDVSQNEASAACNCGGNHSGIVGFDGPGNGHAVTCPVRTVAKVIVDDPKTGLGRRLEVQSASKVCPECGREVGTWTRDGELLTMAHRSKADHTPETPWCKGSGRSV